MRFAAQKTIGMQDMLPTDGSVYMPNLDKTMGSMMKALREWERKRGITYSFKGKYIAPKPKSKPEPKKESAKPKPETDRKIVVPRTKQTPEERKQKRNELNKIWRANNRARSRQAAAEWRAKRTPEQIARCREQVREHRARKRAAKLAGSVQGAKVPLPDAAVS